MDALDYSNDFKPTDLGGHEIQSSHLQLDSIPSSSKSNEVVESSQSSHLQLDSSPSNSKSKKYAQVVDNRTSNSGECSYDYPVAYAENAQAVDNCISNSGQCSYDTQIANAVPLSSHSNNSFTYNGVTYYSYKAFEQDILKQFVRDCVREMQIDGAVPDNDVVDGPRFSECMVLATGGSPAIINPYNGLPWRKGANLCRPYIDEGYCQFGTACVFHHPWPPSKDLPRM